ncbi:hypothetical protein [Pseudomonas matsuisoli]|uniref:hypothetical protein n=1 Tax=Pseudomonas matsuisoli TaxID=1515666 RepID=UPI001E358CB1|nr:hypothetical protein [Pseudomonas matsuisoli]
MTHTLRVSVLDHCLSIVIELCVRQVHAYVDYVHAFPLAFIAVSPPLAFNQAEGRLKT